MLRSILGVTGQEYSRVTPALFAYLFGRITMENFIDYVADRKEGTRLKDIARVNGYILKHCKLYAYACHCARLDGEALPKPRAYGVTNRDAVLLRGLNLKHLNKTKYRPFTLEEFDATVDAMVSSSEIKNNIGKFISKKMSFLLKSYDEKRDDIEAHLKEMAIIAVYKEYPCYESYLHFINIAKAQIHNKGQTFITSRTAKSRQRLIKNSDGSFDATHVPIESLNDIEAPPSYGQEVRERIKALSQIEHKLPDKTRQFLMCAAGQYHEGFSLYLTISNEEAVDAWDYEKYMSKLQAYFGTTPERTAKLFQALRNQIHRCNNVNTGTASNRVRS